jgi:hypothetical protein
MGAVSLIDRLQTSSEGWRGAFNLSRRVRLLVIEHILSANLHKIVDLRWDKSTVWGILNHTQTEARKVNT